eukprot:6205686-Pleurochrysis_carterae.AAC.2
MLTCKRARCNLYHRTVAHDLAEKGVENANLWPPVTHEHCDDGYNASITGQSSELAGSWM